MADDLSDLTLVMCTYNRSQYAMRAIKYWARINVNLIVLDGSREALAQSFIESLPTRVQYLHRNEGWTERMLLGATLSRTSFTSLVNDDEFYLPNSLSACLQVLRSKDEIVSVIGNAVGFKVVGQSVYFRRQYTEFNTSQVTSDLALERVVSHLNPYRMTSLFAVIRTPVFVKNVKVANLCSKLPGASTFELGFELANSYQGQSRVIPNLHWLRSAENPPTWKTNQVKVESWLETVRDTTHFRETARMVNEILEAPLSPNFSLSESILYLGLGSYVKNEQSSAKKLRIRLFFYCKSYSRKFLKYLIGNLVGERHYLNLTSYLSTKTGIRIFEKGWMTAKLIIDSLNKEGIDVSEYCMSSSIESIKSSYLFGGKID
jgi:glycosyltransferase domain-containing protein